MDWKKAENKALVGAVLALKDEGEARAFLRDLLTEDEIVDFAKRLQAARMLAENKPYADIQRATGFSSTTVARVSKWLHHGMGGYTTVLPRIA